MPTRENPELELMMKRAPKGICDALRLIILTNRIQSSRYLLVWRGSVCFQHNGTDETLCIRA